MRYLTFCKVDILILYYDDRILEAVQQCVVLSNLLKQDHGHGDWPPIVISGR